MQGVEYRIWRSPYTRFGGLNSLCPDDLSDETITADGHYTDKVLSDIASSGFNGIWVHGVLANMTHVPSFPEFGVHAEEHINHMQSLVSRAAKHGIKVFVYYQPVRGVAAANVDFWQHHADCEGQHEMSVEQVLSQNLDQPLEMICLCSSAVSVKSWVCDASAQVAERLPGLGGVILITASEYPGHCYSHRRKVNFTKWSKPIECPRCKEREPWEVAAELVSLVHEGIRRHSSSMEVIAWNWGWSSWLPSPCRPLLELLPRDIILMADFERGGTMDLAERPHHSIDEYSLTYAGPSELCQQVLELGEELGLRRMVKLQLGTTHELPTVVDLPLMTSIFRKACWLKSHPEVGYMGCWNFGNMPSANTFGFNFFLSSRCLQSEDDALRDFAESYFVGCDSRQVVRAWQMFARAMKHMPFTIPFMYNGVHSHALSYAEIYRCEPLRGGSAGCSYLSSSRGDDMSNSCAESNHDFSLNELIDCLGKLGALWQQGVLLLKEGLETCLDNHGELGNAVVCGALWQSTAHAYRAYRLRVAWKADRGFEMSHIFQAEMDTLREALPWVEADERLGYHGEAYARMFSVESMKSKLEFLQGEMRRLDELAPLDCHK